MIEALFKPPQRPLVRTLASAIIFLSVLSVGLVNYLQPILLHQLARIPGDLGDARLVNLFLEHNYRALFARTESSFWDPTWLFFPFPGGMAMSEVMSGTSWVYALGRAVGLEPQTAFQWWFVGVSALNFASMALLCRFFAWSLVPCLGGAYLFAFALPKLSYIGHPQLTAAFYVPFAVLCVGLLFKARSNSAECLAGVGAGLCAALQLWSCFYLGEFFVIAFCVAVTVALIAGYRDLAAILKSILDKWRGLVLGVIVAAAVVVPLAKRYLATQATFGGRDLGDVAQFQPDGRTLLLAPNGSFAWEWLSETLRPKVRNHAEKIMFPGAVPTFLAGVTILRLWRSRRRVSGAPIDWSRLCIVIAAGTSAVMWLLPIKHGYSADAPSLWLAAHYLIPGASGIRAPARMINVALLPLGLVVASALAMWMRPGRRGKILQAIMLGALVVETFGSYNYGYGKRAHEERQSALAELVNAKGPCPAFYYGGTGPAYATHIDAMWFSLQSGIPTLNGYSGFDPSGYEDLRRAELPARPEALAAWLHRFGRDDVTACAL